MFQTRLANPSSALQPYVWCYGQSEGQIDKEPIIVPLPARPKQVVTFFLGDPYRIHFRNSGLCERSPQTVVVGPQTYHRLDLLVMGKIDNFTIHFQPAAFHHFFGVPMAELRDTTNDAPSVIGKEFRLVEQQLAELHSFGERIQLIEAYLLNRLRDIGSLNLIGQTANRLFAHNGLIGVAEMATSCHLTPRQFERRFLDQVGVSPKLYARIVRFNAALDHKLQCPNHSWTEIAHAFHYHDQMHMVHDFQDLAGNTPTQIFARLDIIPEFHSTFASSIHLHASR